MNLGGGAGLGYEPEALALFARFSAPPDNTRKNSSNSLVKSLKDAGVWVKLDALYILAAADIQAALLNWVADQYNGTVVGAGTFTADRGWAGNGTTGYIDSGLNPSTATAPKFVQDSAYFGLWSRTSGQLATSSGGYFNGTDGVTLLARDASDRSSARANQAAATAGTGGTVTDGSGLFGVARSASNAVRVSRNGANTTTASTVSTAPPNGTLRFGNFGTASFSTMEIAAGIIGSNLTVADDLNLYNALLTYLQAVGAA